MITVMRTRAAWAVVGCLGACTIDEPAPTLSSVDQYGMNMQGMNMQGMNMQGMNMQGMNMQGMNMQGMNMQGATFGTGNASLNNVHIEKGELVASHGSQTLRGTQLVGAKFTAIATSNDSPPVEAVVEYRIAAIQAELSSYDPTHTGNTYLYTLEQYRYDTDAWVPACGPDLDGRRVAIPVAAIWNTHGDRVESSTQFTFACTTGVIAKCYRWGYRPWLTGYGTP